MALSDLLDGPGAVCRLPGDAVLEPDGAERALAETFLPLPRLLGLLLAVARAPADHGPDVARLAVVGLEDGLDLGLEHEVGHGGRGHGDRRGTIEITETAVLRLSLCSWIGDEMRVEYQATVWIGVRLRLSGGERSDQSQRVMAMPLP